ncbi:MAG: SCO family protein [Rhodospirillales bacterium]|nr:MAG: SCO family protein [Rhodospirillales bacterium]
MTKPPSSPAPPEPASPSAGDDRRERSGRFNGLAVALAVLVLILVGFVAGRHYFGDFDAITGAHRGGTAPPDAVGALGGPFTLTNQFGDSMSDADFRGSYMLVYFGFTFCPDVCPMTLSKIASALDMLEEHEAERIVPILITVDPARDTPEQLRLYAEFFHPRLVALTGTDEQIADVARKYRVYFAKVQEDGAEPDVYTMDHTAITYLMGPDGVYIRHFSHQATPKAIADRLRTILAGGPAV